MNKLKVAYLLIKGAIYAFAIITDIYLDIKESEDEKTTEHEEDTVQD